MKNKCLITSFFPSLERLEKELSIDLDKKEIVKVCNGKKLKFYNVKGYEVIQFNKNGKSSYLPVHRLFFYKHHGYLPSLVDHKDTIKANNNIDNLRELTKSDNNRNKHKQKTSRGKACSSIYKGVSKIKGRDKWVSNYYIGRKKTHIGVYDTEDEAGQAYNDKMRELGLEDVSVMNDTPQERARNEKK